MVPEGQNVPPAGIYGAQLGELPMTFEINHGLTSPSKSSKSSPYITITGMVRYLIPRVARHIRKFDVPRLDRARIVGWCVEDVPRLGVVTIAVTVLQNNA